jgi:phosphoribulokinase
MLGIVGESAAGKTTLTRGVVQLLGSSGVTPLCLDDYHRYDRAERARRHLTASHPSANNLDQMANDLAALRAGKTISKPIYDHRQGTLRGPEEVAATGLVIAYGMLTLTPPVQPDLFDLTVYLDPAPSLLHAWRLTRDVNERGYTADEVVAHTDERTRAAQRFIHSQRARADLVIRFQPGDNDRLAVALLQRRQPNPGEAALLNNPAIELDQTRIDEDGCTSTRLTIAADAPPADISAAQHALWNSLPNAPEPLDPTRLSADPATAFVQTFVAYQLLRSV